MSSSILTGALTPVIHASGALPLSMLKATGALPTFILTGVLTPDIYASGALSLSVQEAGRCLFSC